MGLTTTSTLLRDSMTAILDRWAAHHNGANEVLYLILRAHEADVLGGDGAAVVAAISSHQLRQEVADRFALCGQYWADVRYASLEPSTILWGTIVNSLRVVAKTERATDKQRAVFDFTPATVLGFFQAAWSIVDVADRLHHVFRAIPAPECQAMAALLNVHVDVCLDEVVMCRLARLLDCEGPMSDAEIEDLAALSTTHLVSAVFKGTRGAG